MTKNTLWFVAIIVVGALLGSFLGKFIGMVVPSGQIRDLFATQISAGLSPATLDLSLIELTFGCVFKFNITSVLGIIVAAFAFRVVTK